MFRKIAPGPIKSASTEVFRKIEMLRVRLYSISEPAKARSEESAVYTESGSSRGKGDDEGLVR